MLTCGMGPRKSPVSMFFKRLSRINPNSDRANMAPSLTKATKAQSDSLQTKIVDLNPFYHQEP